MSFRARPVASVKLTFNDINEHENKFLFRITTEEKWKKRKKPFCYCDYCHIGVLSVSNVTYGRFMGEISFQLQLSSSHVLYLLVESFLLLASRSSLGISFHALTP